MKLRLLCLVLFAVWLTSASAIGQTDVFFSFSDFGDGGAFENDEQTFRVGDSGTAYVWVDGDAFMDIATLFFVPIDSPELVTVDSFEVLNSDGYWGKSNTNGSFDYFWSPSSYTWADRKSLQNVLQ